ncbi:hypothetical protein BDZ94DRAFT_266981 [Collybia nuda]|uniref:Uncharacterized protein n=1 Tax=Collybia nuda TaxID=64659 RepID=A0A9P5XSW8_9AGAR|nr:hypothetical protein BDZ94DRAFT_266981 [Collybia nuda]
MGDELDGHRITSGINESGYLTLSRQACIAAGTPLSGVYETHRFLDTNLKLMHLPFPRMAAIFLRTLYDRKGNVKWEHRWTTKFMMMWGTSWGVEGCVV